MNEGGAIREVASSYAGTVCNEVALPGSAAEVAVVVLSTMVSALAEAANLALQDAEMALARRLESFLATTEYCGRTVRFQPRDCARDTYC